MRVEILDYEEFSAVEPLALHRFLSANGWAQVREVQDDVMVLSKSASDGRHRLVWLPLNKDFSDYELMVAKVVSTVADTENRSQTQVVDDLQTVGIGDVIRAGTEDLMNRYAHTLPIMEGERLLQRLRQIAVAGASSVVEKRAVYSYNPFREVRDYIDSLRLAQTEPGSYLMRIIAPLEDSSQSIEESNGQISMGGKFGSVPFARRAVVETMKAVRALHDVAVHNYDRGQFMFAPFRDAVPSGISANLCEAIASPAGYSYESPIEISVTWSYVVASDESLPTRPVRFEPEFMPYIRRAGEEFRRITPLVTEVEGWVNVMGRDRTRKGPGRIRLIGAVEGRVRTVYIELDEEVYKVAAQAHSEGLNIRVTGNIVVQNNRYMLTQPRNLHIVPDSDLFDSDRIINQPGDELH